MSSVRPNATDRAADVVIEAYKTRLGTMYESTIEAFLDARASSLAGQVQLAFFSPPFPLKRKKKYGNKEGDEYLEWLSQLAPRLGDLLTDDGSLVVEIGNAWNPGHPTMSLLPLRALMAIAEAGRFNVCQQFICNNPARLPSPAQWVTVERIRVKDSYTHVWWMSRSERPKADNRRVLQEYSPSMKALLKRGSYNSGVRDSGHDISPTSFLIDHGGAIPGNVFSYSNTTSADPYRRYCKARSLKPHPATMQLKLAEWFVRYLTDEGDLVLDPFAGSNSTGAVAEQLGRRWLSVEPVPGYVEGSKGRFPQFRIPADLTETRTGPDSYEEPGPVTAAG